MAFGERLWTVRPTGVEPLQLSPTESHDSALLGAESGAVPDRAPSPALSLLEKLTAGLTAEERVALARMLDKV